MRKKSTTAADGSRDWTDVIIRRDLGTKQEEIVYQPTKSIRLWMPFELSPDGSRLAIVDVNESNKEEFVATLKVLTLSGGGQKEVLRLAPQENVSSLAWTPDGKRLVYTKETPNKEKKGPKPTAIWSTAIDSGQSVTLKLSQPDLHDFAIHPDGRQITFQTGSVGDTVEVSVMDGLIPKQLASNAGTRPKAIAQGSPAGTWTEILLSEIAGPNNTIFDRKLGVTATIPPGWTIKNAIRYPAGLNPRWPEGFTGIMFSLPEKPMDGRLGYQIYEKPRPMRAAEADAWLRDWALNYAANMNDMSGFDNYRHRPESYASRQVGGHPALSWTTAFTRAGTNWTGYVTLIRSEKGHAAIFCQAPAMELVASRPAFEALVESVRLDAIRTANASPVEGARIKTIAESSPATGRMDIPLEEMSGTNNTILDREIGLSFRLPTGWKINATVRHPSNPNSGANIIDLTPSGSLPSPAGGLIFFKSPIVSYALARLNYDVETLSASLANSGIGPRPTAPAELDSWLLKHPQKTALQNIENYPDYKTRPESIVLRTISGQRAVSWLADFTHKGQSFTEYRARISGQEVRAMVWMQAPVARFEALRPAFETLVESVRLDAVRPPAGSPVEGARIKTIAQSNRTEIPLDQISGPNQSILDRTTGIAANIPIGWEIASAIRWSLPRLTIHFRVKGDAKARAKLTFANHDSKSLPVADVGSWLRTWADNTRLDRLPDVPDYKNRPGSFVARTVDGRRALSWIRDFQEDGEPWNEYATVVYTETGVGFIYIAAPTTKVEALRPAYETLVESVRFDAVRPPSGSPVEGARIKTIAQSNRTEIPLEEISGPDNSILDRKFKLSATLPAGWAITSAARSGNGDTSIDFTSPEALHANINYRATTPGHLSASSDMDLNGAFGPAPTTPAELDAWMRKRAQGSVLEGRKFLPESFVSRTIGGNKAWSWMVDDINNSDQSRIAYWTWIESGKSFVRFRFVVPAAKFEALRPAFDAIIETLRMP